MRWKMDFIQQPATTGLVVEPRRAPKHFWSQTCTKKRSRPLFVGLLPIGSTKAFWIPAKSLHLRSMLSKLMRCAENCKACSWHWTMEWTQFFSMTMPNCTSHHQLFKSGMNWAMKFCLICTIFTWLLANLLVLQVFIICQAFCSCFICIISSFT